MILWPLSKVTTSAMQLGAQEWLMYLREEIAVLCSRNPNSSQTKKHDPRVDDAECTLFGFFPDFTFTALSRRPYPERLAFISFI